MSRNNDDEMPHSAERGTLNKNFAFTLIELLVVIAIIGILSALIIVGMNSTTQKATIAKSQVFANSLRNSLMSNLVSEWKFDNVSGSVGQPLVADAPIPDTWGTNNGTAKNGPVLKNGADCISGQCLSFAGSGDYVTMGDVFDVGTGDFTISVWFGSIDPTLNRILIKKGSIDNDCTASANAGYALRIYSGKLSHKINTGSAQSCILNQGNTTITTGWHNGVVVVDRNGNEQIYLDGKIDKTTNISGYSNSLDNILPFSISDTLFNGSIDDVRIFDAVVSTFQIQQTYFAGLNKLFAKNIITQQDYNNRFVELSNNYAKE